MIKGMVQTLEELRHSVNKAFYPEIADIYDEFLEVKEQIVAKLNIIYGNEYLHSFYERSEMLERIKKLQIVDKMLTDVIPRKMTNNMIPKTCNNIVISLLENQTIV